MKYGLKKGLILMEDEAETMKITGGTIEVLPLWYWLVMDEPT